MAPENLTLEVLKQIRDEAKKTNERIDHLRDETTANINQTNVRLDQMRDELSRRRLTGFHRVDSLSRARIDPGSGTSPE